MVTHDRIRLTGLLRKKPWQRGFFYVCCFAGDSSGWPRGGPDGGFMEPLGAVARRGLGGRAGNEPLRREQANTTDWSDVIRGATLACLPPLPLLKSVGSHSEAPEKSRIGGYTIPQVVAGKEIRAK